MASIDADLLAVIEESLRERSPSWAPTSPGYHGEADPSTSSRAAKRRRVRTSPSSEHDGHPGSSSRFVSPPALPPVGDDLAWEHDGLPRFSSRPVMPASRPSFAGLRPELPLPDELVPSIEVDDDFPAVKVESVSGDSGLSQYDSFPRASPARRPSPSASPLPSSSWNMGLPRLRRDDTMIWVLLSGGNEDGPIVVHETLIRYHCRRFRDCTWTDTTLTIPGVTCDVFDCFMDWMYSGRLDRSDEGRRYLVLLWLLADRMGTPRLQNDVMLVLEEHRLRDARVPVEHVFWVYGQTTSPHPLRSFFAFWCTAARTALPMDGSAVSRQLSHEMVKIQQFGRMNLRDLDSLETSAFVEDYYMVGEHGGWYDRVSGALERRRLQSSFS